MKFSSYGKDKKEKATHSHIVGSVAEFTKNGSVKTYISGLLTVNPFTIIFVP